MMCVHIVSSCNVTISYSSYWFFGILYEAVYWKLQFHSKNIYYVILFSCISACKSLYYPRDCVKVWLFWVCVCVLRVCKRFCIYCIYFSFKDRAGGLLILWYSPNWACNLWRFYSQTFFILSCAELSMIYERVFSRCILICPISIFSDGMWKTILKIVKYIYSKHNCAGGLRWEASWQHAYYCGIWSSQSISVDVLLLGLYWTVYSLDNKSL